MLALLLSFALANDPLVSVTGNGSVSARITLRAEVVRPFTMPMPEDLKNEPWLYDTIEFDPEALDQPTPEHTWTCQLDFDGNAKCFWELHTIPNS